MTRQKRFAARALLARCYTGTLHMLDGKTGKPRAIINIEKAAKVTTKEGRHGPYFAKLTAPDRAYSPESVEPVSDSQAA